MMNVKSRKILSVGQILL